MMNDDGNIDFASFLKADIGNYASEHHKFNCDCCTDLKKAPENHKFKIQMKFLDPKSYLRAAAANSFDVDFGNRLSFSVVHHTMSGYTDFGVGMVRNLIVAVPFEVLN